MKPNPIPVIAAMLLFSLSIAAQDNPRYNLLLKSGAFIPEKNITADKLGQLNSKAAATSGKRFAIIQFEHLPTPEERLLLEQSGIELLDYIPNNAYTVTIAGSLNQAVLSQTKARAIIDLAPTQKMHSSLSSGLFPSRAVKVQGTVDVWISFPKTFSYETVKKELLAKNIDIISDLYKAYNILSLRVAAQRVFELASLPFIEYVQPAPGEDKPLNDNGWTNWNRDGMKASLLNAPLSVGGRNLKGTGVVIGVGDNADPQPHPDFTARLITRAAAVYNLHGTHVAGIVGGAGIRNELRTGFAPKSTIITQTFSGIFNNAPAYVSDYGMVITNNSYGNIDDCSYHGQYDLYSRILDQQAFSLPNLENIFAAGNSGGTTCLPYAAGFRTVFGGYQSAKNVLTVGNARPVGTLFSTSSRGPVRDGRIKPEVIAIGSFVMSTAPNPAFDYYTENTGTSMASPAAAGGAGLLYQHFRQLTGNTPKNALVKALLCNGADDWGNDGPDFKHGFGLINLWRSVDMLENNHIDSSTIVTGATNSFVINVPAGLSKLKVMLAWNDPAASVLASQTLVNDLDLEVETPAPVTTILPRLLDTLPANVDIVAGNGADHINNIEQVTLDNPGAGNYTVKIKGTAVPQNSPQQYFVVYDYVPVDIKVVAPVGGDTYIPGERILIQWDSYGDPTSTFKLEFSSNNGVSWTVLDANVPADIRYWLGGPDGGFLVPNITTKEGLIKVTKNATGANSTSFPFTILTQPVVTLAPDLNQCEGYITINWTSVTGATDYEVMILQGDEMVAVATTTGNTYTFSGLSRDTVYWVTVRARLTGTPGRRAIAIFRKPDSGVCSGTISDGDIKLNAIVSPSSSGRVLTSTALGSSVPVTIRIKNLDDAPTTGDITVTYTLNGGGPVNELITNPAIAGGSTLDYTFAPVNNINLSAVGSYEIQASAAIAGDPVPQNNSLTKTFKQLSNPAITSVTYPSSFFIDNFDAAPVQSYNRPQTGLTGLDRYDFVNSNDSGRIRTFINSGMAYSGNRALTLDAEIFNSGNTDSLTGTFNLATFNAATDDIRLDFRYKNHGQRANAANKVWIRGNDGANWIQMYDLFANQDTTDGSYKLSGSLELGDSLAAHGQSFSSSFQVRWGQWGQHMAADNEDSAGYTFDDIRIYRAIDDIQLVSIDSPVVISCALSVAVPVKITVRNTSNAVVNNVPVILRVDGSVVATENIPAISANDTTQYTFNPGTANLSLPGNHTVEVWVHYLTDNFRENDTARITVNSLPLVSSFPYLENFETNNGYWYTNATHGSTWQYGSPNSPKIKRAASGTKAWKTNLGGFYNDQELSYLYSPCFNLSGMTNPTLSFSLALDIEDCGGVLCDGSWVEYSTNGGTSWSKLGAFGQGTNWYNKNYSGNQLWSRQDYTRWHVATSALPTANNSSLRLRFFFNSDEGVTKDGIAIDDIHIYDNTHGIYDVTGTSPVVNQPAVNGSGWIDFIESGTNKLIASINPNGQNLGSTDVQSYVNTGAVRYNSGQYYHNRNITIKPATVNLSDSATVRFYFLDTETEALINATGCGNCFKPSMAYELGVSKYSDPNDNFENGTISDDNQGSWSFINSAKVKKVPFDKGYYAEFKVKDFSEFWLNNGGFDNNQTLPVQLTSFTAQKKNNKDVLAQWKTASEYNVNRFELEVAIGNSGYQQDRFTKIGEVNSRGNSVREQEYDFTDIENNKSGVRYYRLKIIENDGSFKYSVIRPVVFDEKTNWQVFPNPSAGIFNLSYQVNDGETLAVKLYDMNGKTVQQYFSTGTGFVQKVSIDIREPRFAAGLYLLEAAAGGKKQLFRLIKQ